MNKWFFLLWITVPLILYTHLPVLAFFAGTDTVKVNTVGVTNRVIIHSHEPDTFFTGLAEAPIHREITRSGENNRVEIKTEIKKDTKRDCTSGTSNSRPSDKIYKPEAVSGTGNHINISQTGTNNHVVIKSK